MKRDSDTTITTNANMNLDKQDQQLTRAATKTFPSVTVCWVRSHGGMLTGRYTSYACIIAKIWMCTLKVKRQKVVVVVVMMMAAPFSSAEC